MTQHQAESSDVPSSPEDGSNFRRSLQIDMKGLVGDAVGNMSISPGSRDVVLAARKGLFIIDLEAPLNVPRFLPQGGTWDVADVQWNPHMSRQEYIVSTSSEKLLIWNLYLSGKTSIEHILRSHYRAITDINWHTTDPDVVVSTGIDSWLWAWDLRTPEKPVMGLCAFNAGGTQVKWNRQDGNILASSHSNEVLIWDRRKGSLPISQIRAHSAKIYGIDWSHRKRNELVTCSLDKTIKVWDIQKPVDEEGQYQPTLTIRTAYPIWRARDLPFGHGILSLPQRGETTLEMYSPSNPSEPVERFEGHADVVKDAYWPAENSEFQLITWSKDRTLRFWPIDDEVMEKVGSSKMPAVSANVPSLDKRLSFRNPPIASDLPPALSAPVGHRAILAEVRASQPLRPPKLSALRHSQETAPTRASSKAPGKAIVIPEKERAGTMSRGYVAGRSANITTFAWISSVKVGGKRDDSSGPTSGGESGGPSRISSRSRPPSVMDPSMSMSNLEVRSGSRDRDADSRETESNQSLQEEITSVVNKLTAAKVKLEKADLTKKRTCTFGLHGPWGDSTSVFIRISFTFPRDYPQATHPGGTPQVDLERNPLISVKNRVYILRRLRAIREQERPCLEACLRFLLFRDEDENIRTPNMDSESSSEDEETQAVARRGKEGTFSLLRGDKTLTEPRTSQGVFGPNGELVCFFRAPPRIVRGPIRDLSSSPSSDPRHDTPAPRLFWSPILLSDAVRRLELAARDREVEATEIKRAEDAHSILRIMSNLFTFPHQKSRRVSEQSSLRPTDELQNNYSLLPTRLRSTVYIKNASLITGTDVEAARQYVFPTTDPAEACRVNADTARLLGRVDHERVFRTLQILLAEDQKSNLPSRQTGTLQSVGNPLALKIMEKLYAELCLDKDIQMLAMMSIVLLRLAAELRNPLRLIETPTTPAAQQRSDYFAFKRNAGYRQSPLSPLWSRTTPSPTSYLFNANSMRRFISASKSSGGPLSRTQYSPQSPQIKEFREDAGGAGSAPKSWSEAIAVGPLRNSVSFSSTGHHRRPTFSQVVSSGPPSEERKRVHVEIAPHMRMQRVIFRLQARQRRQLEIHLWAYADMLLAWSLPQKRAELLHSAGTELGMDLAHPVLADMLDSTPLGVLFTRPNVLKHVNPITGLVYPTLVFGAYMLHTSDVGRCAGILGVQQDAVAAVWSVWKNTFQACEALCTLIHADPRTHRFATGMSRAENGGLDRTTWRIFVAFLRGRLHLLAMHFSKTYTQLLLNLPPELRENAIEYRRLKKLIKQVVEELTSIGLSPEVLHKVLLESRTTDLKGKAKETGSPWVEIGSSEDATGLPKVVYEVNTDSDHFEPRLRLIVSNGEDDLVKFPAAPTVEDDSDSEDNHAHIEEITGDEVQDDDKLTIPSSSRGRTSESSGHRSHSTSPEPLSTTTKGDTKEVVISLPSDTVFFEVLLETFEALNNHLAAVRNEFVVNVTDLSRTISDTARPMSSLSSFHAYSHSTNPAAVSVHTPSALSLSSTKSDLYSWREIFQLYVDTEVFESHSERTRGERSIEDAEERLKLFIQRMTEKGFITGHTLKLKESRDALQTFLRLNTFILDLKRFQFATSEATRKILKKHTKRTALPMSPSLSSRFMLPSVPSASADISSALVPITSNAGASLSLILVQAISEILLPVIPHIDDYACVICMNIAFKPIRLQCGHLFCVRCLVKMQKRGQDGCPMCRAPTVLSANRTNVDWALVNFMKDWFPIEAKKKLQQNEREAAEEQMEELGFKEESCIIA
ncbi:hypothetical protein NM688_g25 [Phlebia brevispora]|uniref:Uncharacterized protein n=1 Tax=Phlebia brevispora TaxID=194682 RepID=A0ACC1TFC7_9APHY|nr:hypothetical protein NM688_g25 [Phlebia brevispora]